MKMLFCIFALTAGAAAQTDSSKTLDALLAEVRQLRVAVERAASLGPRVQLLLQRIQIQETKVAAMSRELQDIRNNTGHMAGELSRFNKNGEDLDARAKQEQNPALKKQFEDQQRELKAQAEQVTVMEQQLRAREAEVSSQLRQEQGKLDALESRLDAIEKQLNAGQQ